MISCKRASELISKAADERLSIKEELELKLHNFVCEFCRKFEAQVHLLSRVLRKGVVHTEADDCGNVPKVDIPAGAKERLKKRLTRGD